MQIWSIPEEFYRLLGYSIWAGVELRVCEKGHVKNGSARFDIRKCSEYVQVIFEILELDRPGLYHFTTGELVRGEISWSRDRLPVVCQIGA